jgi:hypothetical protein
MDVGELAKQWYAEHEPEGALALAILRAFFNGVLVKRPDFLLISYPVRTDGHFILPGEPHNCWWVDFVAGRVERLAQEAPYPLDYFAFKRRRIIKVIPWSKIKEQQDGRGTNSPSTQTT